MYQLNKLNKKVLLVGGMFVAGLGVWIASLFPCLISAIFDSLIAHVALYDKTKKTYPTTTFWHAWVSAIICVSTISWLSSLVPPLGCILSSFLGGVAMIFANFFKEELENVSNDADNVSSPAIRSYKVAGVTINECIVPHRRDLN